MRARTRTVVGLVAVMSIAVAVSACGGDDDSAPTEATSASSSAVETTQATAGSTEPSTTETGTTSEPTSTEAPSTDHTCPHVTDVILVRLLQNSTLDLSNVNVTEIPSGNIPEFLGWEDPPGINTGETVRTMFDDNQISAYQVNDGTDSLDVAEQVMSDSTNVVVSPVLLLTLTGHWTMSPADAPQPATVIGNQPIDTVADPPIVAVVDTGYTDAGGDFGWLDARVDPVDSTNTPSFDAEPSQSPL